MRLLTLLLGCLLISTPLLAQLPSYVPTDGLEMCFLLDGNALDSGPHSTHGTISGNVQAANDRFGQPNAMRFFGSCNDRIDANVNTTGIQGAMTFAFWVEKNGNGCIGPRILEFWSGSDAYGTMQWNWDNSENRPRMSQHQSSTSNSVNSVFGNPFIGNNQWVHCAYRNDNITAEFFLNGVLVDSKPAASGTVILASDLALGRMNHAAWDAFNGKLDEVVLYSRVLTNSEIASLANSTITGCTDPTACNYDSAAEADDGSCIAPCIQGCMDSEACNYDNTATIDDGSCLNIDLPDTISGTFNEVFVIDADLPTCNPSGYATFDGLPTSPSLGEVISLPSSLLAGANSWSMAYQVDLADDGRGTLLCKHSSGENTYQTIGLGYTVASNGHPSTLSNNHLTLHTANNKPNAVSSAVLSAGPHTIGLSYENSLLRMFIDGVLDSEHTGDFSLTEDVTYSSYTIGRLFYSYDAYRFRGNLHWAGFSPSALSNEEMLAWMNCATNYPPDAQALYIGGSASSGSIVNSLGNPAFDATQSGLDIESGGLLEYELEWDDGQAGLPISVTIGETSQVLTGSLVTSQGQYCQFPITIQPLIEGCTDSSSCNYIVNAIVDDGSCIPSGCMEEGACNYNAVAECEGEACDYSCCPGPGCCGPGTTWDPILQSCVAETPVAAAAEDCSLFTLQELSSGYLLQQGQLNLQDTLIIGLQQQVDSLNALLNNCPGND